MGRSIDRGQKLSPTVIVSAPTCRTDSHAFTCRSPSPGPPNCQGVLPFNQTLMVPSATLNLLPKGAVFLSFNQTRGSWQLRITPCWTSTYRTIKRRQVLALAPRGLTSIFTQRHWHVFPRRPCLLALLAPLCHLGFPLTHVP